MVSATLGVESGRGGAGALARALRRLPPGALSGIAGLAAVLLVCSPLLFTDRGFGLDFMNSLWLGSVQAHTVVHAGWFPSYFTNTTGTAGNVPSFALFEPTFAFDSGGLFATLGWVSVLLGGNVEAGFELMTVALVAMAYGGLYWLGRAAGLGRPLSHAAPLTYVTGAYYATDLYARGQWAELAGTSAMVLVVAAAVALAREPRMRPGTWALCFLAAFVWAGSLGVTVLFTIVCLVPFALLVPMCWRRRLPPARRLLRPLAPAGLGVAANGWYLVPFLAYGDHTQISGRQPLSAQFFNTAANMLDPLRAVPAASGTPGLYTQLPVWVLAWCLVAAVAGLALSRGRPSFARSAVLATGLWVLLLLVVTLDLGIWKVLPQILGEIVFPYRLAAYDDAALAGLVIAVLALATQPGVRTELERRRLARLAGGAALGAVLAVSLGLQVWQLWVPDVQVHDGNITLGHQEADRGVGLGQIHALPGSWTEGLSYADASARSVPVPGKRALDLSLRGLSAGGTSLVETVDPPSGPAPILTNLAAGPYLISVSGLQVVGQSGGFVVVRRPRGRPTGPVRVGVDTAGSAGVVAGRLLSVLAALCLLGLGAARLVRT